ncbi:MAG: hypothetical protein OXC31_24490, partial [Spirochaetaceae bacterium]|nr:hypothetical protein [Spirochaetaceae bacterium]
MARLEVRDVASEALAPAGRAERPLFDGAGACASCSGFVAGVLLRADAASAFAGEVAAPAWIADWVRAGAGSPAGGAAGFGGGAPAAPGTLRPAR